MQEEVGEVQITDLAIWYLNGSKEAANDLLDFSVEKVPSIG